MDITTADALRALYPEPRERALKKQLAAIDVHARRFIELSPFVVLASGGAAGALDASPRGGAPGFVKVADANTLLIPDSPGNNRLDSCRNIVETGGVGLLFMIPGFDETLRVNGSATLTQDADAAGALRRRAPHAQAGDPRGGARGLPALRQGLHALAAVGARASVPRETLPTMGQMINDQTGIETPPETQQEMARRYAPDL